MLHEHDLKSLELTRDEAEELFPFKFTDGKLDKDEKLPKFPNSTEIRLENVVLGKLGLSSKDFKLGDKMTLVAEVVVENTTHEESLGEDPRMSVTLQMMAMGMSEVEKSLEENLFGASEHNSDHKRR